MHGFCEGRRIYNGISFTYVCVTNGDCEVLVIFTIDLYGLLLGTVIVCDFHDASIRSTWSTWSTWLRAVKIASYDVPVRELINVNLRKQ